MTGFYTVIGSPIGPLTLTGGPAGLTGLYMSDHRSPSGAPGPARADGLTRDDAAFAAAADQLDGYFAGQRTVFDLELDLVGTPFQLTVWSALLTIPYGDRRSYGELAEQIGSPTASRAVGLANGRNPVSIIVPCHRVIGANGSLTGYGGGLERKRALLDLESGGALFPRARSAPDVGSPRVARWSDEGYSRVVHVTGSVLQSWLTG